MFKGKICAWGVDKPHAFKTQVACEAAPSTQLIEHKFT